VLSREVLDAIGTRRWKTSSTFRGHPLTVAAISATLRVIRDEGLVENAAALGRAIAPRMYELVERHPLVRRVIGEGLMWHVELDGPDELDEDTWQGGGTAVTLPELVHREALARGVYIPPSSGQTLWLIPPLIVDAGQLDRAVEVFDEALSAVEAR
jgi:4-aminobutyrate aminotransferase-like enzyme